MATNVPAPVLTDTGYSAPTEAALLAGFLADFNAAFGTRLNPALETPQGQLATSLAALSGRNNDLYLQFTNGVDPRYSSGALQDAIGLLYGITRKPAQATSVTATVTGLAGTVIPAGSLAVATDGTVYAALGRTVIPSSGNTLADFQATTTGPIPLAAHALTGIYRAIPGWDRIDNATAGVTGTDVESRADFETRRAASVTLNASGVLGAIRAVVGGVSGVTDVYVTENVTGSTVTTDGVAIPPHSIYVAASGGTDLAVATAIWSRKSAGAGYAGNTTVTVPDGSASYSVTFQRPTSLRIRYAVSLALGDDVPSDAEAQVRAAVLALFPSLSRIGVSLYASQVYAALSALGPWVRIVDVAIGSGSATPTGTTVSVGIDDKPTLTSSDVLVTVS